MSDPLTAALRPQVVKPPTYRAICLADIAALRRQVLLLDDAVWKQEDALKENRFGVFHSTQHIIARFIRNKSDPANYYSTPFWAAWRDTLLPVLESVAAHYSFAQPDFPKAMLARLKAGGEIDLHIDQGPLNLLTHKIHVPIVTSDAVWFQVMDQHFQLAEGMAYELNNIRPHGVRNGGTADRIHLIFEIFDRSLL